MNPELYHRLSHRLTPVKKTVDNSYLVAAGLPPRRGSLVEIGGLCYTLLNGFILIFFFYFFIFSGRTIDMSAALWHILSQTLSAVLRGLY